MSRLSRAGAGVGRGVRRVNWAGVVRVALVGGAAVALVQVAATHPVDLDLVNASGEESVPLVGTSLATRVVQACPGPELSGIPGVPDVPVTASVTAATGPEELLPVPARGPGRVTVTSGSTKILTLEDRPDTQSVTVRAKAAKGASAGKGDGTASAGSPVLLTAEGSLAPAVAGTQEWRLNGKDLRGLVTTPCAAGGSDLWLLGGGSGPGRLERLVITNPGANPVTTDVTVHGMAGQLADPVVQTVAPGARVSVLLDARYGSEKMPAVHIGTDGGAVQATLTDTWVSGSTALGADTTVPASAPATLQVVPGVVVDGSGRTAVRVAVPGEQDAVVKVTVLGRDGLVPVSGESVLSVTGGGVGELPLDGLPDGTYAVSLSADVPVVASAFVQVGRGEAPGDIAWSPAASGIPSVGGAAFSAVRSVARSLHLVTTDGNSTAEILTVVGGEPRTRQVDLLEGRLSSVDLDGATSVWVRRISGSGEPRGTVVSSSGSGAARMVSSMPLQESPVTSEVSRAFPLP